MPAKRVSAWIAETDPKYARAWLASLPLADGAESAREIYQALYTLNRQELDVARRFELMELYNSPVATVTAALEPYFTRAALPLTSKKRQLAEFIRQLHMEMSYGYKGCLQDLDKQRLRWGKKSLWANSLQRAMHYLGEVLLHSYQVYMPYPPEVWHEIHAIHRYAMEHGLAAEVVEMPVHGASKTTLAHDYTRILLLGLSNPYQLPQNECRQVQRFLHHWGAKASLRENLEVPHPAGHFLVDLTTDSPPVPFPRDVPFQPNPDLILLDATELLHTIQFFIQRLQKGDSARTLSLGLECLDSVCLEILQRMLRSWGLMPRRQYSRIQRSGPVFVCVGIPALHFFAGGQKPFSPPTVESRQTSDDRFILPAHIQEDITREARAEDEDFIALDEPVAVGPMPQAETREFTALYGDAFRVDRWQIKDAAPKGLQLVRQGSSHTYVRVGDVVGIQQMDEIGRWSAGVVRWMKSPRADCLEMGIELLAAGAKPVAVAPVRGASTGDYQPALLLPAIEALRRPATLLLSRGVFTPGSNLMMAEEEGVPRPVRLLQRLEHTSVFELIVFADVLTELSHP
jgi:cyclic-di-GMP-binding protein